MCLSLVNAVLSVHTHGSPYLPPHSPQKGCFVSVCFASSGHLAPLSRVFTDSQCVYRRCNECRFRKRAVNASEGVCRLWSMLRTLNSPCWHFIILEFIVYKYNTIMCDALLVKKWQASKASIAWESDKRRDILSVVWFCFYGVVHLMRMCFDISCRWKLVTLCLVRTWCNTVNV